MRILFVASQLHIPQLYGGVQTSTDELCAALIERGHKVALHVKLMPGGAFGWTARAKMAINKLINGTPVAADHSLGYPVWRSWFPQDTLDYVCKRFRPDLIIIMSGGKMMPLALAAKKTGVPLLVQLHDIAFEEYGDEFKAIGQAAYIANSAFTATKYRERYGTECEIINPFISVSRYKSNSVGDRVTFINPVRQKGLDIALEVARQCPDIPFTFIEGWTLSKEQREALDEKLATLSNVQLLPNQRNMQAVYDHCKILLVPSRFPETFGRVVAEAQTNGIPVVGSSRGGLPETIGTGGVILDPDGDVDMWVSSVRNLWNDPSAYTEMSEQAFAYSRRAELDRSVQTDLWEAAFTKAVGGVK